MSMSHCSEGPCARQSRALLWCAACVFGCTGLADEQDAYSESLPLESNWDCLDDPSLLRRTRIPQPVVLRVVDLLDMSPVPGVSVRACGRIDANCESPLAFGMSDAPPIHTIAAGPDFGGVFRLEAPGYLDSVRFVETDLSAHRTNGNIEAELLHVMLTGSDVVEIASDLGVPDPTLAAEMATLGGPILDCNGVNAVGAEMFIVGDQHPGAVAWSIRDGLPQRDAPTGVAGAGGFVLVPESTMTVCGRYRGREFGGVSVRMRNGQLTTVVIRAGLPCES